MAITRRTFLRILGIGTTAAVAAPKELLAMLPPVPAAVDTATVPTVAVFDAATRDIYSEMLKQAYGKSLTKIFKSQHQGMPGNYDYLLLKPSKSKEEAD